MPRQHGNVLPKKFDNFVISWSFIIVRDNSTLQTNFELDTGSMHRQQERQAVLGNGTIHFDDSVNAPTVI